MSTDFDRNAAAAQTDERLAALDDALKNPLTQAWLGADMRLEGPLPMPGIVAPLPRRKLLAHTEAPRSIPPMAKTVTFEAGALHVVHRLFIWIGGAIRFLLGNLVDRIRGLDMIERRALRLRRIMERMGPTFIKLGQQLSIRADILPYAYCRELSKMQDAVAPFPTEQAIAIVERVTGRRITETFAVFDPVPIGSASIACVYQAVLKNGDKVAVKVRRPGVGGAFAADLRALGWLMILGEALSIIRSGMTKTLRRELQTMLFEELNYRLEARYTELFARGAKEKSQFFLSAPKVYFELCGEDVLVTEFISGLFLKEILEAIDRQDEKKLAEIKAQGIDLPTLAKRMIRAFYYETSESILFHADPHPANIVARPDNTLVFIDFGSCGRFSTRSQRHYEQLWASFDQDDADGMVWNAISVLEPLPPIDIHRFRKEFEALFWEWLHASKSTHAEWWERCTGQMWMKFIGITRRYNVPMNVDTLRLFRATFLYDSMAMRLWNDLDMNNEYITYAKERGRRARKRVRKALRRRLQDGPKFLDYVRIEDTGRFANQVANRLQYMVDSPDTRFASVLGKAAFSVSMTLKVLVAGGAAHVFVVLIMRLLARWDGLDPSITDLLTTLVSSPIYQAVLGLTAVLLIRRILVRLEDVDVSRR
jgi:predicted unusual protein kinase regulating ubiquinone biosynthesis (AarF/ABC1/UbiB family)